MPSVAGVIWAVAVWDAAKSPNSHIVKAVNERKVRKKRGFLCVDFMVFLIYVMTLINSSTNKL